MIILQSLMPMTLGTFRGDGLSTNIGKYGERKRGCEIFAGSSMWSWSLRNRGRLCDLFDLEICPRHDLALPLWHDYFLFTIRHRFLEAIHIGICCRTFSHALRGSYRANNPDEIYGKRGLESHLQSNLAAGNAFLRIVANLVRVCIGLKIQVRVENPAGSFLLETPEFHGLRRHPSAQSIVMDYCRFTHKMITKPIALLTNVINVDKALDVKWLCKGAAHKCCLEGQATKLGSIYPARLCAKWADRVENAKLG